MTLQDPRQGESTWVVITRGHKLMYAGARNKCNTLSEELEDGGMK